MSLGESRATRQFRLVRWFMVISLAVIGLISFLLATLLSNFLTRQMLERDAQVSMEFVNSIVRVQQATSYFFGDEAGQSAPETEEFFRHVSSLPEVIRANVYGFDRRVLWSSDPELIGRRFSDNDDLEGAFRGVVTPEIEVLEVGEKQEHIDFPHDLREFVEYYLPIWSADDSSVIGAVELYKAPEQLLAVIHEGQTYIWIGSVAAALALYAGLLVVVVHANRILRHQEQRLIESERLAVVGEMASAVAHGLRNPLAAIRSCAELALLDNLSASARQPIADIVSQSDRLESWIRSFLVRAREDPGASAHLIPLDDVIRDALLAFAPQMATRRIICEFEDEGDGPLVAATASELKQVLNTIFSNSIEAMEEGGELRVLRVVESAGVVRISVTDTGHGIPDGMKDRLFKPFSTGKSSGLGVGLSLARRIIERIGGTVQIANVKPRGAEVVLRIPGRGAAQ